MFPLRDNVVNFTPPVMMYLIILVNVAVFLSYAFGGEAHFRATVYDYGTIPAALLGRGEISQPVPAFLTLFTAMFLHGGFAHLFGNMYFLWIFGDNVQERMGAFPFLLFYLATGVIAGLVHVFASGSSAIPAVGASGAISGVLGAYLVMFPRAVIRTIVILFFITVVDIPAGFYLTLWFVGQLLGGVRSFISPESVGIAFLAHIGGFVAGMILAPRWPKDPRVGVAYSDLDYGDVYHAEPPVRRR